MWGRLTVLITATFLVSCGQSNLGGNISPQETNAGPFESMCSVLSFGQVQWPAVFVEPHRSAFSLALNVTGSFEAYRSKPVWNTISNNFDKQGMSLGLFQQNFGQGTLQPLLIEMLATQLPKMQRVFSPDHLKILSEMLLQYKNTKSFLESFAMISPLDINKNIGLKATTREQVSVEWARQNLYVGGKFIPQWKKEFTTMALLPEYISLQIRAAQTYHKKALDYFEEFKFDQIRSYLMMVDIVVQNGGFYTQDFVDFAEFMKNSPQVAEGNKLKALLELRLRHVLPEWVEDVRSRKTTIINGAGTVHGSARYLESEYCYNRFSTYN